MTPWKPTPKVKLYEALGALADGRVIQTGPTEAQVTSSDSSKTYKVRWSEDFSAFSSNDNASKFLGYAGYPILAVLLHLGRLRYDPALAEHLRGVLWKKLNDEYKRDYEAVVEHVLSSRLQPEEIRDVRRQVDSLYEDFASLSLIRL